MSNRTNSRRGSNTAENTDRRGLGATIKRVLKIKGIILLILIILSVFGVLYIIDWFRGLFDSSAVEYYSNQFPVFEQILRKIPPIL